VGSKGEASWGCSRKKRLTETPRGKSFTSSVRAVEGGKKRGREPTLPGEWNMIFGVSGSGGKNRERKGLLKCCVARELAYPENQTPEAKSHEKSKEGKKKGHRVF